ncbi:MAG: hypothetical protein EOO46_22330 [Flavobacterium sp.]|nr:MAG: hypothetical protein EOO46_22330 [Flavobacterium sp.]
MEATEFFLQFVEGSLSMDMDSPLAFLMESKDVSRIRKALIFFSMSCPGIQALRDSVPVDEIAEKEDEITDVSLLISRNITGHSEKRNLEKFLLFLKKQRTELKRHARMNKNEIGYFFTLKEAILLSRIAKLNLTRLDIRYAVEGGKLRTWKLDGRIYIVDYELVDLANCKCE